MKIQGVSGTIYETIDCTHPGIYLKEIDGQPQICCDEASGNHIEKLQGQNEVHLICGKCKKILQPFQFKPRHTPR